MYLRIFISIILLFILFLAGCQNNDIPIPSNDDYGITNQQVLSKIEDGVHIPSGLKAGLGLTEVLRHCISCHSAKLITQNRATKDGWKAMIDWMYETQNLPHLGKSEPIVISYLAEHYPPTATGRRKALSDIEWYDFSED